MADYYSGHSRFKAVNLARFDGIRYGHVTKDAKNLLEVYEKSRAEGFGDEAKRRILTGTYVLSAGYYDAYYNKSLILRQKISDDFKKAFADVDAIAMIADAEVNGTGFVPGAADWKPIICYVSGAQVVFFQWKVTGPPPPPLPELPAGILLGLGLVGLVGFGYFNHKKNQATSVV